MDQFYLSACEPKKSKVLDFLKLQNYWKQNNEKLISLNTFNESKEQF